MLVKVETWGGRGGGAGKNGNSHKNENGSPVIGVEKIGNLGSGSCSSIGTLNYGDGKSVQALGGRKITGKAGEMAAEKGDRLLKGGKFVSKKSEGLRFVILTDYVEEEHIAANNLAPSNEIVSKISNQITSNDKQIIPTVNKYLIDPAGGKGKFTEPLQENMSEGGERNGRRSASAAARGGWIEARDASFYQRRSCQALEASYKSLSELDQSPPASVLEAMQPFLNAIVKPVLLKHQDKDVKLLVATCICEITRITAPEAPYSDDVLKDVFQLI
ncbi:hypothetical protein LWI28_028124 [Acer negundo]|uniref:Uncharacterized protein n=1 Tax=Acer negundo TaxID=4023 RepID=A0AAD5IHN7_ACENE|nr:hypothetical protein LWI28_028124 [Acer negundo]